MNKIYLALLILQLYNNNLLTKNINGSSSKYSKTAQSKTQIPIQDNHRILGCCDSRPPENQFDEEKANARREYE